MKRDEVKAQLMKAPLAKLELEEQRLAAFDAAVYGITQENSQSKQVKDAI